MNKISNPLWLYKTLVITVTILGLHIRFFSSFMGRF